MADMETDESPMSASTSEVRVGAESEKEDVASETDCASPPHTAEEPHSLKETKVPGSTDPAADVGLTNGGSTSGGEDSVSGPNENGHHDSEVSPSETSPDEESQNGSQTEDHEANEGSQAAADKVPTDGENAFLEDEDDEDLDREEENDDVQPASNDDGNEDDDDDDEIREVAVVNGGGQKSSSSRRKSPQKIRPDLEEDEEDMDEVEDASSDEVEEIQDDDDDDSDIMEVDAEDPLGEGEVNNDPSVSGGSNVVTIDDLKTIQRLASSASKKNSERDAVKNAAKTGDESANVVMIDTNSILAGKATSGVTITPTHPKSTQGSHSSSDLSGLSLPSGVTISQTSKNAAPESNNSNNAFAPDKKGQLNDPNLTDDTFVVEAPSFIVPYVYEKPPKETFDVFKEDIQKLTREKAKEEEAKRKEDKKDDDDEVDIVEVPLEKETPLPKKKPTNPNFFESTLGKFFTDLGMNLVQEAVQTDLLKDQIRRSQKDKSAAVMHAIKSLRMNLESSKEANEPFRQSLKKCRFCSFRTESDVVLQNHLETPHMRQFMYRCNFCSFDTKLPQDVLQHMLTQHGVKGHLERAPGIHQCPLCPFEDNMKGKLTRHKNSCDKRYRPEKNQDAPLDWEPPAKIPKPQMMRRPGMMNSPSGGFVGAGPRGFAPGAMRPMGGPRSGYPQMPQLQFGPRGRGRPPVGNAHKLDMKHMRPGLPNLNPLGGLGKAANNPLLKSYMNNQVMQALQGPQRNLMPGGRNNLQGNSLLSSLGSNSSVTIQSVNQRSGHNRSSTTPSISITPLPGRQQNTGGSGSGPIRHRPTSAHNSPASSGGRGGGAGSAASATVPSGAGSKGNFVICEICDGYIKDLDQLRNHMLWIHKVKIHPKMIYNRPPLNCQKCQFRFFTDQGLERHLLGSHGLVTASMQDLANKGQDSGRCPVCGKVFQWKLLNHVAKDHQKTLKPAHLSYKCTVCTATFGQYKLFENHVYQAHSGAAKKADRAKQMAKGGSAAKTGPVKVPQDITIIPKPASSNPDKRSTASSKRAASDGETGLPAMGMTSKKAKPCREKETGLAKSHINDNRDDKEEIQEVLDEDSDQEGVEEIQDEEPKDD
ncbi:MOG interacting and ectopic P-granules protein 1-like isoform X2 [Tigriopus californicus]|nr:MOG interacting and ectopic P-granules protein 1-like isoform X2 [Tigriopus californicus]